jgi:hypothetical protein
MALKEGYRRQRGRSKRDPNGLIFQLLALHGTATFP